MPTAERKFLDDCLKLLAEKNGTDLHIKAGEMPRIRVRKKLIQLELSKPSSAFLEAMVLPLLNVYQKKIFEETKAVDFAIQEEGLGQASQSAGGRPGRFRVNAFYQKGELALVMRVVTDKVPDFQKLQLPQVLERISMEQRGLILIVGPVGSGKSTTIAAMLDYINHREDRRVITVEDPIEYLHRDDRCFISQREIGLDAESFLLALRSVVRQDPDIIMIGEIRDAETFQASLAAAETGRLVISTVHGKSVTQGFERLLGFYPREQHSSILAELSYNLRAMISQRLLPRMDGEGLIPACEVLIMNPSAGKVLREGKLERLNQVMQIGELEGMQTFNRALLELFQKNLITREEALAASDNPHSLEMNMKGIFLDEAKGGILGS